MAIQDPPVQESIVEGFKPPVDGFNGKIRLAWILWLQDLLNGDRGQSFAPGISGLTSTGTPTITAGYYTNQGFTDFYIVITPATNTSSVAGTTYITLPFTVAVDTTCSVVAGLTSATLGVINAATDRVYPPTWTNDTRVITITGRVLN